MVARFARLRWAGVLTGLLFAAGFWLVETAIHAFVFELGSFREELLHTSANELWMRLLTCGLFVLMGALGQVWLTREAAARGRTRMLTRALEQAGESILITDAAGVIEYVNPAFSRLTGYASSEALGRTPALLRSGAQQGAFYEQLWRTILAGEVWSGNVIDRRKEGDFYPVKLTIGPVRGDDGEVVHFVGIQTDLSAQVAAEERLRQAEKLEALGTLVGGVAHDFNNMLTGLLWVAELGEIKAADSPELSKLFGRIIDQTDRATRVIEQLLVFARRPSQVVAPYLLRDWLVGTWDELSAVVSAAVSTSLTVGEEPVSVEVDKALVQQVLSNLLANASDALEGVDDPRISVTLSRFARHEHACLTGLDAEAFVALTVSDNGPGVSEAVRAKVFEPFFTTKAVGKGSGLGLSMVHSISESWGGRVTLDSGQHGATFTVFVPLAQAAGLGLAPGSLPLARGTGQRILLAEDEDAIRGALAAHLEHLGYRVVVARDGVEALACFASEGPFELVILDWVMPGRDGVSVARALRASNPTLPLLLMTGSAQGLEHLDQLGVTVLAKPHHSAELARTVASLLA